MTIHWKRIWVAAALFLSLILWGPGSQLQASDYYTSVTSGKDSYAGTLSSPFQTIAKGLSVLKAGDTLYVRGGTYAESISGSYASGTSWTNPVTVTAYGNERVTLKPNSSAPNVVRLTGTSYFILDGLSLDAANLGDTDCVKLTYASSNNITANHIRISDCEIMNAKKQGVASDSSPGKNDGYNEFIDDWIHNNGTDDFDHGLYIRSDYNLIQNCKVYDNAGWGVHIYNGASDVPDYNKVIGNYVYDNATAGARGYGIGLYSGTGNSATNNYVWGNKTGIDINFGASNSTVSNNYLWSNGSTVNNQGTSSVVQNNSYLSSAPSGFATPTAWAPSSGGVAAPTEPSTPTTPPTTTTSNYVYNFKYTYASGDYYTGTVYADSSKGYSVGYKKSVVDENGQTDSYQITAASTGSQAKNGQVYVNSYYDGESKKSFTPLNASAALGSNYLGSESGYIIKTSTPDFRFGGGYYEADLGGLYSFQYTYGNGDYYTGQVYASQNYGYSVGEQITKKNELGLQGYYAITGISYVQDTSKYGQVVLNSYYNSENRRTYRVFNPSGSSYLGSEYGYIYRVNSTGYFGKGYYEADVSGY